RLRKKLSKVEKSLKNCEDKLKNKKFLKNAPEIVVKREIERKDKLEITAEKLKANISFLE
ncbi:MAG: valine--tRNA ligase, partial [Candidatus Cloacimonetes bacterium]|nr:valine--tRNA ligase [Candidatus Cloacimonadota bacterium]